MNIENAVQEAFKSTYLSEESDEIVRNFLNFKYNSRQEGLSLPYHLFLIFPNDEMVDCFISVFQKALALCDLNYGYCPQFTEKELREIPELLPKSEQFYEVVFLKNLMDPTSPPPPPDTKDGNKNPQNKQIPTNSDKKDPPEEHQDDRWIFDQIEKLQKTSIIFCVTRAQLEKRTSVKEWKHEAVFHLVKDIDLRRLNAERLCLLLSQKLTQVHRELVDTEAWTQYIEENYPCDEKATLKQISFVDTLYRHILRKSLEHVDPIRRIDVSFLPGPLRSQNEEEAALQEGTKQ